MKEKNLLFFAVTLIVLHIFFFLRGASAQSPIKIAVLPFSVHSETNAADLKKQLQTNLVSDLVKTRMFRISPENEYAPLITGRRIDEKLAMSVGEDVGADFVIFGSLTQLGQTFSIDAKVLPVRKTKPVQNIFVQGRTIENLPKLSAQLADKITTATTGERRIASIAIKGNRKIEVNAILNVIKSSKGKNFSEAELTSDIKAIYKMGYFSDVKADVEDSPEGKIVTFILQEKPTISEIKITGNKAIDTKDIEGAITTRVRQFINMDKLRTDVEKVRNLYIEKGYLNVEIKTDTKLKTEKDVIVTFDITENKRLFIKTISFEGNQAFTEKELRNMMETNEWSIFHFFTDSGVLKKDKLKEDTNKLTVFYLNNGYIHAKIGEPEVTNDNKWIYITIPIAEGRRFKVGKVDITGELPATPKEQLLAKLNLLKKDHYDREAIMKDMDFLTQAVNDEGYAYADVVPQTVPHDKEQIVDVTYNITKGDKVYFNKITVSGNTKTRDKVIRRELGVTEGELYNRGKLKESYMRLNRLRYFEEIDFQTEKGPEKDLMDVNIRIKEKPTGMFSLGAGYSAVDAMIFSAQVSQQNLFGRGQSLGLAANFGSLSTSYDLYFVEPWLFDIPLWSKYELWHMDRQYDTYDLNSKGLGVTFGYPLWEKVTGYLGYRLSMDNVSNLASTASFYTRKQAGETTTSGVTATLLRDTTDDYLFPTRGTKNSISVEYTGGPLLGTTSYAKYLATSSWFHPLPKDSVFGIRGRIGFLQELEGKDAPIWSRFYLGGISSLRGLRNVGPVDPESGEVIGGLTMLNFNTEVVFPLIKNAGMKGVVFFDTGNAWSNGYYLDDLRKTAGLGIRWYSPIGPLRLEWGYVLDRKDNEAASRLEFTMGMFM